jgi:hypothetical protein
MFLQSMLKVSGFVILLFLESTLPSAEEIHEDSCGEKSLGETSKRRTRRLTSSPKVRVVYFWSDGQGTEYRPKLVRSLYINSNKQYEWSLIRKEGRGRLIK